MRVDRDLLLSALQRCASVAPRTGAIPILACVRMEATSGFLQLAATDLVTSVECDVPCDGDLAPCCVPARLVAQIVGAAEPGEVSVDVAATPAAPKTPRFWSRGLAVLRLAAGSAEYQIATSPAQDFPARGVQACDEHANWVENARKLLADAARVSYACDLRSAHAFSHGVWISADAREAFDVIAVDGYRIARVRCGVPRTTPVCVPRNAIRLAAALPDPIRAAFGPAEFVAESAGCRIVARMIDAALPPVDCEIPERAASPCVICREHLDAVLTQAASAEDVDIVVLAAGVDASNTALVEAHVRYSDNGDDGVRARIQLAARGVADRVMLDISYLRSAIDTLTSDDVAITVAPTCVRIDGAEGEVAVIAAVRDSGRSSSEEAQSEKTQSEKTQSEEPHAEQSE